MVKATYKLKINQNKVKQIKGNVKKQTIAFAYAIADQAKANAPVLSGALLNSIRVTDDDKGAIYILAGGKFSGKSVPYARAREYKNKTHPNTRYYMKRAFKWGRQNYKNFFKGLTK